MLIVLEDVVEHSKMAGISQKQGQLEGVLSTLLECVDDISAYLESGRNDGGSFIRCVVGVSGLRPWRESSDGRKTAGMTADVHSRRQRGVGGKPADRESRGYRRSVSRVRKWRQRLQRADFPRFPRGVSCLYSEPSRMRQFRRQFRGGFRLVTFPRFSHVASTPVCGPSAATPLFPPLFCAISCRSPKPRFPRGSRLASHRNHWTCGVTSW